MDNVTQSEEQQKAALRKRIADIAYGAGIDGVEEDGGAYWNITAGTLGNFIIACRRAFYWQCAEEDRQTIAARIAAPEEYKHYDGLNNATEFLYSLGVRG